MAVVDPISQFYARLGYYPANSQQWWLARAEIDDTSKGLAAGDFLPELLDKLFIGNMRAPKGHYILQAFNKDRAAVSGVTGIPAVTVDARPPSVAFFSGRVWYACRSTVYYSQILTDKFKAGFCFQEADPTSEHISDPVATDGGVIEIPEASKIIRLLPHGGGMLVFAKNGVWFITGNQEGFTSLDISVNKVSPIGCKSPGSIIETEDAVFWWADSGIMGMSQQRGQFGPTNGFDRANISDETIQTFYNNITEAVRNEAKGVYDPKSNVIMWLFRDTDVLGTQYNKTLVFDLTLKAFYPWKYSSISTPRIKGFFISNRLNTYSIPTDIDPSQIEFITLDTNALRIGQTRSGSFVDWPTISGGATYNSYMEAGYELFDDAMRDKNITYLFTYLTRTETSATGNVPDFPSSCQLRIKWDWASGSQSNKWTTPVEVYRSHQFKLGSPDTGFGMVVTKNKVRGNGKAIQFRFESSAAGKNFDLNGWSVEVSGNTTP